MSGLNNMNEWEDSWKALHKKILRHERQACQKHVVKEFNHNQSMVDSYRIYYRRNRKEIDKDIAKTTSNEMRMWIKVYAKLMKGQEN